MKKIASQFRLDEDLYEKLKIIAERERRTMNGQLEYFLANCIRNYENHAGIIDLSLEEE